MDSSITLESTSTRKEECPALLRSAQETLRVQSDTGYPQAIILSGTSGSGKTYNSMVLLRHLFNIAGGGPGTDVFKHLTASFTVLRSLGSARTCSTREACMIVRIIG